MSTTYLNLSTTVKLDANGNGKCSLSPSVGQFWAPLMVRVSTVSQVAPVPHVSVYHGSPVLLDASTFVDDTFLGNGDTTSMLSGISVVFGDAITAVFSGGTPNDTAILTIFGMDSDTPPNLGIAPSVPGTHFVGKPITESTSVLSSVSTSLIIAAGNSTTLPASSAFDMRQYNGFYFTNQGIVQGTDTGVDSLRVTFNWSNNPTGVGTIYQDVYEWFYSASAFPGSGPFNFQDRIHGPFLSIQFTNTSTTDGVDIVGTSLIGTTRTITEPVVRQIGGSDGTLAHTIGAAIPAGGVLKVPCFLSRGLTEFVFHNSGAANMTFNINRGTLGTFEGYTVAAGGTQIVNVVLPNRAARIDVAGTVGQVASVEAYTQFEKK